MSKLLLNKFINTIGIDEAGRGAWAGPVVASAVFIRPGITIEGIDDSKKLSKAKREYLYKKIIEAHIVGVGIASALEIDNLNILQATIIAMKRAIENIDFKPELILVDGNYNPNFGINSMAIIGGDGKYESIAAASIIAKVTRDRIMDNLSHQFPQYSWHRNVGYGTKNHIEALNKYGINEYHRLSYKPIKEVVRVNTLAKLDKTVNLY